MKCKARFITRYSPSSFFAVFLFADFLIRGFFSKYFFFADFFIRGRCQNEMTANKKDGLYYDTITSGGGLKIGFRILEVSALYILSE